MQISGRTWRPKAQVQAAEAAARFAQDFRGSDGGELIPGGL